jgi:hypothetical protein
MNTFSSLNPEINDEEIDGEKKYRNVKKKIRRLKEKDLLTEEQEKKLRILGILVQEYENRNKGIPEKKAQPKKNKKKSTNKEEEDLLNKEYEKNKDYWKKKGKEEREKKLKEEWEREQKKKEQKERERKLKEEWEKEQKNKEQQRGEQWREQWWREQQEQHHQHQQRQKQQKQQNNNYNTYRKKSPEEKFCENYNTEVPQDIINLYRNYSTKKYRELALKYHPDKGNNNIEYQKMINNIKDIFK